MIPKDFKISGTDKQAFNADVLLLLQKVKYKPLETVDFLYWMDVSLDNSLKIPRQQNGFGFATYNAYKNAKEFSLNDIGVLINNNLLVSLASHSGRITTEDYLYFLEIDEAINKHFHEQYKSIVDELNKLYAVKQNTQEAAQKKNKNKSNLSAN